MIYSMATNNIDMLNYVRTQASPSYQDRIPQATRDNIRAVGNAILEYKPMLNEFVDALINKIGLQVIDTLQFEDPLGFMNREALNFASDIEDIWVAEAKAFEYNEKGDKVWDITKPKVHSIYHRQDRRLAYKVTLYYRQVKEAFTKEYGFSQLLTSILSTLPTADKFDTFVMKKQLYADYQTIKEGYYNVTVPEYNHQQDTADSIMVMLRQYILRNKFPATDLNKAGVLQSSTEKRLKILINMDVLPELDVYSLSKAFHQEKVDYQVELIPLDDFGDLPNTYFILIDSRLPRVHDTLREMASIYNPDGLYWNYWYHHWQLMSMSIWYNAVRFTTNKTEDGKDLGSETVEVKGVKHYQYFDYKDKKGKKLLDKTDNDFKVKLTTNVTEEEAQKAVEMMENAQ